jgi:hypothetical protein
MGVAGSLNIVFRADLSPWVAHRPSVLYWILQPGSDIGGIGMGVVRMVRPWNEWLTIWGYDVADGPPELSEEFTTGLVRRLVGVKDLDVEVLGSSAWTVNHMVAEHYGSGRVFCGGDAVHRHPPSNGLGSNTSIQDSFNLAWKLALVLRGAAGPELLDTYNAERAPIGRQVVDRANRSIAETGRIFDALGVSGNDDPTTMRVAGRDGPRRLHDPTRRARPVHAVHRAGRTGLGRGARRRLRARRARRRGPGSGRRGPLRRLGRPARGRGDRRRSATPARSWSAPTTTWRPASPRCPTTPPPPCPPRSTERCRVREAPPPWTSVRRTPSTPCSRASRTRPTPACTR